MVLRPTDLAPFALALHELAEQLAQARGRTLYGDILHDYRVCLRRLEAIAPLLYPGAVDNESMALLKKERAQSNVLRDRDVLQAYLREQMPDLVRHVSTAKAEYQPANKRLKLIVTRLAHWSPPACDLECSRFVIHFSLQQLQIWALLHNRLLQLQGLLEDRACGGEAIIHAAHRLRVVIKRARYLQEWQANLPIRSTPVWPALRQWQDRLGYASDRSMIAHWLQRHGWQHEALLVHNELAQWLPLLAEQLTALRAACDDQLEQLSGLSLSGYFFH